MSLSPDFVPTKSSVQKQVVDFESVKYVSYKPKKKANKSKIIKEEAINNVSGKSNDLRKLRYEVIKLGTSGMDPTSKEASSIALAVSLGAKPPKNKYQNYKEILAAKKDEMKQANNSLIPKQIKPEHRHLYVVGKKVIPAKPKSKEGPKNFLESYGKPGRSKLGKGFKKRRPD